MGHDVNMELPEKGFYIHYKHDPAGAPHNYMYEVVGVGRHTEDRSFFVLYRPLYESTFMPPADFQCRPLDMFMETVEINGTTTPRFRLVTDPALISELELVRENLYGKSPDW